MKFREKEKIRRKKNQEAQLMTKTEERQRKVTSQVKHKIHTENSKKAPPEQMHTSKFQLTSSEFALSSPFLPLVDNV
jgi:hypothetical protein